MNTLLRLSVLSALGLIAACSSDPKEPQPPATPPVEVTGGAGVIFSDWRVEGAELVGDMRLEGDWEFAQLEIAAVLLDATAQKLAQASFEVATPETGHTQTIRMPMPEGAARLQIAVNRTSLLTCDNAVDHALGIVLAEYGSEQAADELAAWRAEAVTKCGEETWSDEFLACLMKVDDERGIANCETAYAPTPESLRAEGERPGCIDIGKRRTTLARKAVDTEKMDAESREFFERMLAANERDLVRVCVADQWPEDTLDCMLAADDAAVLEACRPAGGGAGAHNPMAGRSQCQTTAEHLGKLMRREMLTSMPPQPQPPQPPPPAAAGTEPSPEAAAAQEAYDQKLAEYQQAIADYQYQQQQQDYFVEQSTSRFANLCGSESWSADARRCILKTRSLSQLEPCEKLIYGDED